MENIQQASDILANEIQNQSEAEAKAILSEAERDAKVLTDKARADVAAAHAEIMKKAEIQAEALRRKIVSGLHLEIKKQELIQREEAIEAVFASVASKLEAFRATQAYDQVLSNMLVEGTLAVDSETCKVVPGDVERKRLTAKLLDQAGQRVKKIKGKTVAWVIDPETLPEAGLIVSSGDGRTKFDNRISARMKRMREPMRLAAIHELIAVDGK
jgi:vacuolar-type H+-ATPase subunit E/Vma4